MYVHLNGKLISEQNAVLPITDLAILRGYGIFDFLPVINQIPLFFDLYLDRFYASAAQLGLEIPYTRDAFKEHAHELIQQNDFQHSGLRFVLTGGNSADGFTPTTPNFFMMNQPYKSPTAEMYANGVKLIGLEYIRSLPQIKSLNYLRPIQQLARWKSEGAYDLLYHQNGVITESSRSNFFIIHNEKVLTPKDDILLGVTRKKVMECISELGIPLEETLVTMEMLKDVDEAFITSSTKGLLAIRQVDDLQISQKEGVMSAAIRERFMDKVQTYVSQQLG